MSKEQMTIRLYPETRRQMDSWLEESNSKNRNEFVEKALRFYMGYLGTENITEYLSDALVATLRGIVADSANRTNSLLFKCAVEQGIMAHTIAAHFRDTMEDRRALRGVVCADALEHRGAVVDRVRHHVGGGLGPGLDRAVVPDLLGELHRPAPRGGGVHSAARAGRGQRRVRPDPATPSDGAYRVIQKQP